MRKKDPNILYKFTQEQNAEIEATPQEELAKLAEKYDVPLPVIRKRKWYLVHKEELNQKRRDQADKERATLGKGSFKNSYWTKEEKYAIMHSKKTDEELALELKRSTTSIRAMRCRLLKAKNE